jgi:hypothetical protein
MDSTKQAIPVEITITIVATPSGRNYQTTAKAEVRFAEETITCKVAPMREIVSAEWLTHYTRIDLWLGEHMHTRQLLGVRLAPSMRAFRALIKRKAREAKRATPPKTAPSSP